MQRRHLIQAAAAAAFAPLAARAQSQWPTKAIRIVVPFTPGGTTDFVTRLVAAELAKSLGQPVMIENKPGAGTVIGVDSVAKSVPDGSSFVTVANSFCVNQTLVKNLPYDAARDLRPVALMGLSEHVLATHPGSGFSNLADLVAAAKKAPGKLNFGSGSSSSRVASEMLKQMAGIDLVHVPYKGVSLAQTDLISGQIQAMLDNVVSVMPHVRANRIRAIAVATAKRSSVWPDMPTVAESFPGFQVNAWAALLGPAGLPGEIVQRLQAETARAVASEDVRARFASLGVEPMPMSAESAGEFMRAERERWARVIRDARLTFD